jgi:hypothetical protein
MVRFYEKIGMAKDSHQSAEGCDIFVFEIARAKEFLITAKAEKWVTILKQE